MLTNKHKLKGKENAKVGYEHKDYIQLFDIWRNGNRFSRIDLCESKTLSLFKVEYREEIYTMLFNKGELVAYKKD